MERVKRGERLAVMARILTASPNKPHTLGEFSAMFDAAKSTVSEDIDMLRDAYARFSLGTVTTVAGAAGGVIYRPLAATDAIRSLAFKLSQPGRLLPGGFLYTADVCADPMIAGMAGETLAAMFYDKKPDIIITMEASGIPVALMTARVLSIPLVIARRDSRAYEGPAVKINYVAGDDRIETMTLSRKAVAAGARALIIDDFAKGGGTLRGMAEMMREFDSPVVGIGVLIATAEPKVKRISGVKALLTLVSTDAASESALVVPTEAEQIFKEAR